ncbi:MAG: ParA family protein [Gammaproteobacteria bacterium]|nr:ParA family protein [Gammaproteobacteria bacterium]
MTHTLAIANQKGGVGKTTTAINLAASLVGIGKSVLLLDLDPQGNASSGSGTLRNADTLSAYHWLGEERAFEHVVQTRPPGMDVVPSDENLTAIETDLLTSEDRTVRLRNRLDVRDRAYDYTIIDCPPSLNVLTVNAFVCATGVIVPLQCEYFPLEGLTSLLNTVERIRSAGNPGLHVEGLLRTMYDPRLSLTQAVSRQLFQHFPDIVYRTVIPRNVRLAEAPSHGVPVLLYEPNSKGSTAYAALANEIIRRHARATDAR